MLRQQYGTPKLEMSTLALCVCVFAPLMCRTVNNVATMLAELVQHHSNGVCALDA